MQIRNFSPNTQESYVQQVTQFARHFSQPPDTLGPEEIRKLVLEAFPGAQITTALDPRRQGIVDSWPADVDDSAARKDWGLSPRYDLDRAFQEYLIPNIRKLYQG